MEIRQQQGYAARIGRVVDHLGRRLAVQEVPDLAELAGVAALSPCHFHRVYRLMTGETVAETVQRLRLATALSAHEAGASVAVAAQQAGYSSGQSLARALQARVGQSMTGLARSGEAAAVTAGLRGPVPGSPLAIELVSVAPFRVVSMLSTGDYADLNLAYGRLFEQVIGALGEEAVRRVYGMPVDDPRDVAPAAHRFRCCLDIGDLALSAPGLETLTLGGDYAVRRHHGPYADVPAEIDALYMAAIAAGRELADAPVHVHYVDQPAADEAATEHESHLYLPVV